jgi:hypothetical protein
MSGTCAGAGRTDALEDALVLERAEAGGVRPGSRRAAGRWIGPRPCRTSGRRVPARDPPGGAVLRARPAGRSPAGYEQAAALRRTARRGHGAARPRRRRSTSAATR